MSPRRGGPAAGHDRAQGNSVRQGPSPLDLTVVIPAADESPNLAILLPALRAELTALGVAAEVIVVARANDEATAAAARAEGAAVLHQSTPGYGGALRAGFAAASCAWVLTMDGDLSHPPAAVADLWRARDAAGVLVASRYAPGGSARMPPARALLSRLLNRLHAAALGLPVKDLSSGFRLYRREALAGTAATATTLAVLQELLVAAHAAGWTIREIPFAYAPRRHGRSHARLLACGREYVVALPRLRAMRAGSRRLGSRDSAPDPGR